MPTSPSDEHGTIGRRSLLMRGGVTLAAAAGVSAAGAALAPAASAAVPPPSSTYGFVPVAPYRAYDSRDDTFGPLMNGYGVDLSVLTDSRNAEKLPASAAAITFNLTITLTRGIGFLTVYPGDQAAATSASNINWLAANVNLANGGTVKLGTSPNSGVGSVLVVAQGPTGYGTHFILDVTGYYY